MDMELSDAIFQLAVAIITVLAVLITRYVVPWVKANTTGRQRDTMEALAVAAYSYAVKHHEVEDYKEKAVARLHDRLNEYGIKASEADLWELIEDADKLFGDVLNEIREQQ
jgi:hypothetical protein